MSGSRNRSCVLHACGGEERRVPGAEMLPRSRPQRSQEGRRGWWWWGVGGGPLPPLCASCQWLVKLEGCGGLCWVLVGAGFTTPPQLCHCCVPSSSSSSPSIFSRSPLGSPPTPHLLTLPYASCFPWEVVRAPSALAAAARVLDSLRRVFTVPSARAGVEEGPVPPRCAESECAFPRNYRAAEGSGHKSA